MKTMRMPKGWTLVGTSLIGYGDTETKEEKIKRMKKFDNVINNLQKRSIEDMEKDADDSYEKNTAYKAQLFNAFNEKKLKSKALIKEAKILKKNNNSKKY